MMVVMQRETGGGCCACASNKLPRQSKLVSLWIGGESVVEVMMVYGGVRRFPLPRQVSVTTQLRKFLFLPPPRPSHTHTDANTTGIFRTERPPPTPHRGQARSCKQKQLSNIGLWEEGRDEISHGPVTHLPLSSFFAMPSAAQPVILK